MVQPVVPERMGRLLFLHQLQLAGAFELFRHLPFPIQIA